MKKKTFILLLTVLTCLFVFTNTFSQTQEAVLLTSIKTSEPVSRMVWNETESVITLVTNNSVENVVVSDPSEAESYQLGEKTYRLTTVSESGVAAALSDDWKTIYIYDPASYGKEIQAITPGFTVLSVSVSKDGTQVLADSADQIRTVIYDGKNGSVVHDLTGFETAAPVYDSSLSADGTMLLWHSRGTFALQNIADGSFGKTISLWDFASSFELSPDNRTLAVGIINEDYENGTVLFFDPSSGTEKGRAILGKTSPYELSFNNDSSALWAADAETLYTIDPNTFEVTSQLTIADSGGEDRISRIAAAPNGKTAAVLMNNGDLFIVKAEN